MKADGENSIIYNKTPYKEFYDTPNDTYNSFVLWKEEGRKFFEKWCQEAQNYAY